MLPTNLQKVASLFRLEIVLRKTMEPKIDPSEPTLGNLYREIYNDYIIGKKHEGVAIEQQHVAALTGLSESSISRFLSHEKDLNSNNLTKLFVVMPRPAMELFFARLKILGLSGPELGKPPFKSSPPGNGPKEVKRHQRTNQARKTFALS